MTTYVHLRPNLDLTLSKQLSLPNNEPKQINIEIYYVVRHLVALSILKPWRLTHIHILEDKQTSHDHVNQMKPAVNAEFLKTRFWTSSCFASSTWINYTEMFTFGLISKWLIIIYSLPLHVYRWSGITMCTNGRKCIRHHKTEPNIDIVKKMTRSLSTESGVTGLHTTHWIQRVVTEEQKKAKQVKSTTPAAEKH